MINSLFHGFLVKKPGRLTKKEKEGILISQCQVFNSLILIKKINKIANNFMKGMRGGR